MIAFLAHAASASTESIEQALVCLRALCNERDRIVVGRDDHAAGFKRSGSWNVWIASVVRRYDAVIVLPIDSFGYFGRATAQIVDGVLQAGKPVVLLDNRGVLQRLSGVRRSGGENLYKNGFMGVSA